MWPLGDSSHCTENCSHHPRASWKGKEHQESLCLGFLDPGGKEVPEFFTAVPYGEGGGGAGAAQSGRRDADLI